MTKKKTTTLAEPGVQIRVEPDGRFKAPIRLFRHRHYTVQRGRDGELVFTPVQDTAFPLIADTEEAS